MRTLAGVSGIVGCDCGELEWREGNGGGGKRQRECSWREPESPRHERAKCYWMFNPMNPGVPPLPWSWTTRAVPVPVPTLPLLSVQETVTV